MHGHCDKEPEDFTGQQLQDVLGMHDHCDKESEDHEKHDITYNEGPSIATEGENIPSHAEILEHYEDSRRKKEDLYASAGEACGFWFRDSPRY
jgi:hypothetical protein